MTPRNRKGIPWNSWQIGLAGSLCNFNVVIGHFAKSSAAWCGQTGLTMINDWIDVLILKTRKKWMLNHSHTFFLASIDWCVLFSSFCDIQLVLLCEDRLGMHVVHLCTRWMKLPTEWPKTKSWSSCETKPMDLRDQLDHLSWCVLALVIMTHHQTSHFSWVCQGRD